MGFKTQFSGYTPELDLSSLDWTKRWNTACTAEVLGINFAFVFSDEDVASSASFSFPGVLTESGKYVVAVSGQTAGATGVQGVSADGQLGNELVDASPATGLTTAFWLLNPTSFANGDINILFNSVHTCAGIVVWRLYGEMGSSYDAIVSAALGISGLLSTSNRNVVLGHSINSGDVDANDTFWANLRERADDILTGTTYRSAADKLLITTESSVELAASVNGSPTGTGWTALGFFSAVTYFVNGQSVEFEKQSSDAAVFWSWDTVPQIKDVEIVTLLRPTTEAGDARMGILARGAGSSDATSTGYAMHLAQSGSGLTDRLRLIRRVSGAETELLDEAFDWSLNINYWMKLQARGTTVRGKVWAESASEPGDWTFTVTDTAIQSIGYSGVYHADLGAVFELGHFEVRELFAEWPSTVPFNWTVDMSGGPQSNKVAFAPDIGPTIDRRRGSSVARKYQVECPGLSQEEYLAFITFYHTTLKEGTLPFNARDPFTGVEKTWKFGDDDPAYQESFMRPVGANFEDGLYKLMFNVVRLD